MQFINLHSESYYNLHSGWLSSFEEKKIEEAIISINELLLRAYKD